MKVNSHSHFQSFFFDVGGPFLNFLKIIIIFSFWLCWAFVDVWAFSLVATHRGSCLVVVHRLPIAVASHVLEHRL